MRVAVLGQGSIGRRHAAVLRDLGHDVVGFDVRPAAPAVEGVQRAESELDALAGAAAAVVASPPSEHLRQARMALQHGLHTLVEKPFAPSEAGVAEVAALAHERGLKLAVAMNMRFHPGVEAVRRLVGAGAIGRPLRASIWFGSWLPGWRPGADYRELYSARSRLGGGVLLDAAHELDYAVWTLGPVVRVRALLAHESSLELDVEDVAALVLEHAEGTVTSVTLDYLDRAYNRGCRVVGEQGTVEWSWERQVVLLHREDGRSERLAAPSDVQPTYREQLAVFLAGAGEDHGSADERTAAAEQARATLALADAARRSSSEGVAVALGQAPPARAPARSEAAGPGLRAGGAVA